MSTRLISLLAAAPLLCCAQEISGEKKLWHNVVLTFDGPGTTESADPNPFLSYRLDVTFTNGTRSHVIPGYFAADGNAAETAASAGGKWRVHFVPDEVGTWTYRVAFRQGPDVAVSDRRDAGKPVAPDGLTGTLAIGPTDKTGRDHRAHGMLRYVGEHYARYAGSGEFFIQVGSQSPENFLAYHEFDNTADHGGAANKLVDGLHRYEPHIKDWRPGDPVWHGEKGKGIIGALNYLAGKGMNTFYSLTMNVGGDGREIFPWIAYDERARYDVSKLAQWEIVFSHMDRLGLQLMLITQEEENEQILGKMTPLRKLYYRELIARFSHHHALLWDLSEEADRWRYYTTADIHEMANFIRQLDPWKHPIQYVQWKGELLPDEKGYGRLLGFPNFDGTALQHDPEFTHGATRKWVDLSAASGHKWLVGVIEINPTSSGVVPDAVDYWHDRVRKNSIWGNLMAGGSGSVHFFGFAHPNSDLDLEDFRSRDHFWDLQRFAHQFFTRHLPFHQMRHSDALTPNELDFVFAKPGEVYAIYLPDGGVPELDLTAAPGSFSVRWYDPRFGGELLDGTVTHVEGGGRRVLGEAPNERGKDWAVLVRRTAAGPAVSLPRAFQNERNMLVKLRTPLDSATARPGNPVEASVISPESYLGGYLDGTIEAVADGRLLMVFRSLRFNGRTFTLQGAVTDFVNSKGHPSVDDTGRAVRVEQGALTADGALRLDEGAELKLRAR